MKAAHISKPGAQFEIVAKEIPEPGRGEVQIKVEACGICHSDELVKEGLFPGIEYPRVPGHEVAGLVAKVGEGVTSWQVGQRVGVGWHGGHCFICDACREGDFANCINRLTCGISYDGGYAEYMVAPQEALARIPDELSDIDAAPLLCAGITTYNALRNSGARGGDLVAIQGMGGLGHLGIQYANKLGFKTVALSRGRDKEQLARQLGAHVYIDTQASNVAEELTKLGGARVILATAPSSKAITELVDGLSKHGTLLIAAASGEPLQVSPLQLLLFGRSIEGWYSGTAKDSEDTLNFSALTGVRPRIETYTLDQVNEAYEHMISGQARFRAVLKMS